MSSRFVRTTLASLVLAVPVAVAACSSGSEDVSSQSDQALTHCPAGLSTLSCDSVELKTGIKVICTCEPLTGFYDVVPAPTQGRDTCGTTPIAIPKALAPYGCTTGVMIDGNQPIWACPPDTPLPHSLGLVHPPEGGTQPVCSFPADGGTRGMTVPCEAVLGFTFSHSNCIGRAPSGWKFIMDTEWVQAKDQDNGGCKGQCSVPVPPGLPGDGTTSGFSSG